MAKIVRTRVRTLNVRLPDWYTSREAEGWPCDTKKKKAAAYQPPSGVGTGPLGVRYEHPYGDAHMHMGDLKVSPCAPGPKVPVKKKKKKNWLVITILAKINWKH